MIKRLFLAAAALFLAAPTHATPPLPPPPAPWPPPRLLIMVAVDGLTTDLFNRHRSAFGGGLARLGSGTLFRQSGPFAPSELGRIGDQARTFTGSRRVVVAGDQANALALAGTQPETAVYWNGTAFAGTPTSPASQLLPRANSAVAAMIARAQPALQPPPSCAGASATPQRFARAAGDAAAFTASPALDGAVLAVGAGLIGERALGGDTSPDVLTLGLTGVREIAGRFGTSGDAMCLQLLSLDRDLGSLFTQLDNAKFDYAVVLAGTGTIGPAPLAFWRPNATRIERPEQATAADLQWLIAAMLALGDTARGPGRCLPSVPGVPCPPR